MEITGRLTKDATVNKTKNETQVVHFTIAVNTRYRPKGSQTYAETTTYFNCAYWRSAKIATALTKGLLLQLSGDLSAGAFINAKGEAKADLKFHVKEIRFLSQGLPRSQKEKIVLLEEAPF